MLRELAWDIYSYYYNLIKHYPYYNKMLYDVIDKMELRNGLYVLDAGCGTGNLEEKLNTGIYIEAIDSSKTMIKIATKKFHTLQNFNFKKSNLEVNINYRDNLFDRVVCINTLHIIKNYENLINEFHRILKKSGILILVFPKERFNFIDFLVKNLKYSINKSIISTIRIIFISIVFFPMGIIITFFENKFELAAIENCLKSFKIDSIQQTYSDQSYLISAIKV